MAPEERHYIHPHFPKSFNQKYTSTNLFMKKTLFLVCMALTITAFGQSKYYLTHFQNLTEIVGTPYVIASVEGGGKISAASVSFLLFIHTATGDTHQADFTNGANLLKVEQLRIDSLAIHVIVVEARTVDLDGKLGIDWNDPRQIIILSADGKAQIQLTDNNFFVRTWTVNRQTGAMVITGHYDSNNNQKFDKHDKSEIQLYDLKTLTLIRKI
jgi:hypothetical protein